MIVPLGLPAPAHDRSGPVESNVTYPLWSLVVWFVVGLIFAFICAAIAGGKGYPRLLFGVLGFFFACITLIIVLVIPRRNPV